MLNDFQKLVGNEQIKAYLRGMVEKNLVGNSLLFSGPDGVGKSLFAIEFAKLILRHEGCSDQVIQKIKTGNHPDVHILRPEGKIGMHSIDTLRRFTEEVHLEPYEATRKFFIIHDADRMLATSANALLKTFEEPSLDSIIILLSNSADSLLPTIRSRCRTLHFHAVSNVEIEKFLIEEQGVPIETAASAARLADGSISHALRIVKRGGEKLRRLVFGILSQSSFSTYKELSEQIKLIAEHIEAEQKAVEEALKHEISPQEGEAQMTALQKEAFIKEVSGGVRMKLAEEADEIFNMVLSWYRDIELLKVESQGNRLFNPDYKEALMAAIQSSKQPPFSVIQETIKKSGISIDRSTSLQITLETLFLKLCFTQ